MIIMNSDRNYLADMRQVSYSGYHNLGRLFDVAMPNADVRWGEHGQTQNYVPNIVYIVDRIDQLNTSPHTYTHQELNIIFPISEYQNQLNPLHDWCIEYNNGFLVKYQVVYNAPDMQSFIHANVYGITNVAWPEYSRTYGEAITMAKLGENL
jgi:hypothetical protein